MGKKDKSDKKRKHDKVEAAAEGSSTGAGGFSLFGAPKDANLDSVFNKSVSDRVPVYLGDGGEADT